MRNKIRVWRLWLKELARIVRHHATEQKRLNDRIRELEELVVSRTTVDSNISASCRDASYVIVVGRYKSVDYIETFVLGDRDFGGMVDSLRQMSKLGVVGKVDAPPELRAVAKRGWML